MWFVNIPIEARTLPIPINHRNRLARLDGSFGPDPTKSTPSHHSQRSGGWHHGVYANASLVSLDGLHALAERGVRVGSLSVERNESLAPEVVEAAAEALGSDTSGCGNLGQDPDLCRCPFG